MTQSVVNLLVTHVENIRILVLGLLFSTASGPVTVTLHFSPVLPNLQVPVEEVDHPYRRLMKRKGL